jgi:hypothetical protein
MSMDKIKIDFICKNMEEMMDIIIQTNQKILDLQKINDINELEKKENKNKILMLTEKIENLDKKINLIFKNDNYIDIENVENYISNTYKPIKYFKTKLNNIITGCNTSVKNNIFNNNDFDVINDNNNDNNNDDNNAVNSVNI